MFLYSPFSSDTQYYLAIVLSDGFVRLMNDGEVLSLDTNMKKGKYILLDSNFNITNIDTKNYLKRHIYAKSIYRKVMKFILFNKKYSINEFFNKYIWSTCSHLADFDTKNIKHLDESLYSKIFERSVSVYGLKIEESDKIFNLKIDLEDNGIKLMKVKNATYRIEADIDLNDFYDIVISSCMRHEINILDISSVG